MVIIEVSFHIDAQKRDQAIAAMRAMGTATRLEEGCLHYRFYNDLEDPTLFFVYERWTTGAALDAHIQTPHMAEYRLIVPPAVVGPTVFARYDIEDK